MPPDWEETGRGVKDGCGGRRVLPVDRTDMVRDGEVVVVVVVVYGGDVPLIHPGGSTSLPPATPGGAGAILMPLDHPGETG